MSAVLVFGKDKGPRMMGLWFKQFRERLGTDRAKVLIDVSKALATVSFIGAGTVLPTSLFSTIVLIVGGFIFLSLRGFEWVKLRR
jgi:hypothetical protein